MNALAMDAFSYCTITTMLYAIFGLCSLYIVRAWFKSNDTEPPVLSNNLPVVGHGLLFLGDSVGMYDTIRALSEESLQKGGVAKIYLGPIACYILSDPEDSLLVSLKAIKKMFAYDFGRPLLGNGLLSADVATWKIHRKLLNPAFSQQVLCGFLDVFNSQALRLVGQFANHIAEEFDHEKYIRINNLETICTAVTGLDSSEYANLQKQYLPHFDNALHLFNERSSKFWLHSDLVYSWSSLKKKENESMKYVNELTDSASIWSTLPDGKLLTTRSDFKRIIEKKKSESMNPMQTEYKPDKMKPLIDLLLDLANDNPSFTDKQIRSETNTIIAGGHDTTASALAFAITLLGSYPEVQEKAYKEILEVIGDSDRNVDKNDLMNLVYIEAILKETLRLFPSVPIMGRNLDKEIKLRNYTLKANSICFFSIYGLNRHKIWGPDAHEFKPDRWLDKDALPDTKYYASFGLGRRTCIGKTYSMMGMKIILVHVLKKYRISSDVSKMVIRMDIMIRPKSGHHITLKQRNVGKI